MGGIDANVLIGTHEAVSQHGAHFTGVRYFQAAVQALHALGLQTERTAFTHMSEYTQTQYT